MDYINVRRQRNISRIRVLCDLIKDNVGKLYKSCATSELLSKQMQHVYFLFVKKGKLNEM